MSPDLYIYTVVDGKVISSIGRGICVLLGISRNDTRQESDWMLVYKIWLSSQNCSRHSRVFFYSGLKSY